MKTPFERDALGSLAEVNVKCQDKRFIITLIRPCVSEEVSMEMITAPGQTSAFINAQHYFPGAKILSVEEVPEPLPLRAAKNGPHPSSPPPSPGARFIRGMFRPALRCDDLDMDEQFNENAN